MKRIYVLLLALSALFWGKDAIAQPPTANASTNIQVITLNSDPNTFAGPNHPGVVRVVFENLEGSATIPIGSMRVVVTLNSFVNYVSPGTLNNFAVESSGPTFVTLVNNAALPPGFSELNLNVVAVSQTVTDVVITADIEVVNPLVIQEITPGNNASEVETSVGPSALPVTLAYFGAKAANKHAVLDWTTSSEKNNAFFEVQHSTNARDFQVLGKVAGHGTTFETQKYQFTHEYPDPSVVHYYRLRQVDVDGKFEYSPVRSLTFESYIGIELKLATNPAIGGTIKAFVDYGDENLSNQANLVLYDIMGRTVSKQSLQLQKGRNSATFQGLSLGSGLYLLSLQNPSLLQPKLVKVAVQ
ncbi:hypothetical protein GCM10027347_12420 [Larkinella harenae]